MDSGGGVGSEWDGIPSALSGGVDTPLRLDSLEGNTFTPILDHGDELGDSAVTGPPLDLSDLTSSPLDPCLSPTSTTSRDDLASAVVMAMSGLEQTMGTWRRAGSARARRMVGGTVLEDWEQLAQALTAALEQDPV